jgi:LAO/AO transport system kinase
MGKSKKFTASELEKGISSGNRVILAQAITLIESRLPEDNELARKVLEKILPLTGKSLRIGITGVPGAGKSTFIEAFGKLLTSLHKKVAVLAVDPSSSKTSGSILGDKTRMEELAVDPLAFIRPSPTGNSLGGITSKTRETMLLCEAAGYEIILIETVGVGQSETLVHDMVDFFLLLMLTGAGDELQMIKKGIVEMADAIVINKADGENFNKALQAKTEIEKTLHDISSSEAPPVNITSALNKTGIPETWSFIDEHLKNNKKSGTFKKRRQKQNIDWMYSAIRQMLEEKFFHDPKVISMLKKAEKEVQAGKLPAINAAIKIIKTKG